MEKIDKLYICQNDNGGIEVLRRFEVDEAIKDAEESEDDMPFTVLGSLNPAEITNTVKPYLTVVGIGTANYYEVIMADSPEAAKAKATSKKRLSKGTVKSTRDLSEIVNAYYE